MKDMIISESGINWEHFTELTLLDNNTVRINARYRLYYDEYNTWPDKCKTAISHPNYSQSLIMKETNDRIAMSYFVPEIGWCRIVNPMSVFSYKDKP